MTAVALTVVQLLTSQQSSTAANRHLSELILLSFVHALLQARAASTHYDVQIAMAVLIHHKALRHEVRQLL
jgi:hypothetical protein